MGDSGISDGGEGAAGTSAAGMAQQRRARKVENELKRTRERYERGELPSKLPDQGKGNISRAEKLRLDVDRVPQVLKLACRCKASNCIKALRGPGATYLEKLVETRPSARAHAVKLKSVAPAPGSPFDYRRRVTLPSPKSVLGEEFVKEQKIDRGDIEIEVCVWTYQQAYAIRRSMWKRVMANAKLYAASGEAAFANVSIWGKMKGEVGVSIKYEHVLGWIEAYLETCDFNPVSDSIMMDPITVEELWQVCNTEHERQGIPKVSYSYFAEVSSVCAQCVKLTLEMTAARGARNTKELLWIKEQRADHFSWVRDLRVRYMMTIEKACQGGDWSWAWDIMDQTGSRLPILRHPAAMMAIKEKTLIPFKVLGLIAHGNRRHVYLMPPWVKKGGNLTGTAMLLTLASSIAAGKKPTRTVRVQFDGGSENYCKVVFSVAAYLVEMGVVDRIIFTRLPVGHTHNDVDQMFSVFSRHFFGSARIRRGCNARTPEEYIEGIAEALKKQGKAAAPLVQIVTRIFDFEAWLKPHMNDFGGYAPEKALIYRICEDGTEKYDITGKCSQFLQCEVFRPPAPMVGARIRWRQYEGADKWFGGAAEKDAAGNELPVRGVLVLTSLPSGEPPVLRPSTEEWKDLPAFKNTMWQLSKDMPTDFSSDWDEFISDCDAGTYANCALEGFDLEPILALGKEVPTAPQRVKEKYFTVPKLAVDPIWDKRTRPASTKNAEVLRVLAEMRAKDVRDIDDVEIGTMVVSAVGDGCEWALRIKFGKGSKDFPTCVLVQVKKIEKDTEVGEPRVQYRYWKNVKGDEFIERAGKNGTYLDEWDIFRPADYLYSWTEEKTPAGTYKLPKFVREAVFRKLKNERDGVGDGAEEEVEEEGEESEQDQSSGDDAETTSSAGAAAGAASSTSSSSKGGSDSSSDEAAKPLRKRGSNSAKDAGKGGGRRRGGGGGGGVLRGQQQQQAKQHGRGGGGGGKALRRQR